MGAIEKQDVGGMPRRVEIRLTAMGRELLGVAEALERWLARAPRGPIGAGTIQACAALKALAGGWGSTILRALAERPLSLTELDVEIPGQSYPVLERRLAILRATGQVVAVPATGRCKPYSVSEWAREAVAPLVWAGRCERRYRPAGTAPVTSVEVEAAFLLAMPQVRLPPSAEGRCVLGVGTDPGDRQADGLAGVTVSVERGRLASCRSHLASDPPARAAGTVDDWLGALTEGRLDRLDLGGRDPELAQCLVTGLAHALTAGGVDRGAGKAAYGATTPAS